MKSQIPKHLHDAEVASLPMANETMVRVQPTYNTFKTIIATNMDASVFMTSNDTLIPRMVQHNPSIINDVCKQNNIKPLTGVYIIKHSFSTFFKENDYNLAPALEVFTIENPKAPTVAEILKENGRVNLSGIRFIDKSALSTGEVQFIPQEDVENGTEHHGFTYSTNRPMVHRKERVNSYHIDDAIHITSPIPNKEYFVVTDGKVIKKIAQYGRITEAYIKTRFDEYDEWVEKVIQKENFEEYLIFDNQTDALIAAEGTVDERLKNKELDIKHKELSLKETKLLIDSAMLLAKRHIDTLKIALEHSKLDAERTKMEQALEMQRIALDTARTKNTAERMKMLSSVISSLTSMYRTYELNA